MTYFLDFRVHDVGGAVSGPHLFKGDGALAHNQWQPVQDSDYVTLFAGRNVLFAAHGFNVSRPEGACSLGQLDIYLQLNPPDLFVGLLWPGDCWLPIVDYPFEGDVVLESGRRLANFCNEHCAGAASVSFVSHSLGARLVLEAITHLHTTLTLRSACLTAGAINRNCFIEEYVVAADKRARFSVLASHKDDVLKYAFAVGDPFSDLLHDDHSPFQKALGSDGPPHDRPQPVARPWQIPDNAVDSNGYGHGNYLPPSTGPAAVSDVNGNKWKHVADFMRRAFLGQTQIWPPS